MKPIYPGKLIVFEGGEGSGKTTQMQRSLDWLQQPLQLQRLQTTGFIPPIMTTREPGGTDLGKDIRQLLLTPGTQPIGDRTELLLYAADRAQHVEECLKPALMAGAIVLCDRFTDSTVAYQGYGRGLDLHLIEQLNQIATGGLVSDLTLWLDVAVETGLTRANRRSTADRMEQNSLDFHHRVRHGFSTLAATYPQRIVRVDANPAEEEVSQQVQAVLVEALERWYGEGGVRRDKG